MLGGVGGVNIRGRDYYTKVTQNRKNILRNGGS